MTSLTKKHQTLTSVVQHIHQRIQRIFFKRYFNPWIGSNQTGDTIQRESLIWRNTEIIWRKLILHGKTGSSQFKWLWKYSKMTMALKKGRVIYQGVLPTVHLWIDLLSKAQYFYSFKASYNTLYDASQMFCSNYTVLQNKMFEKPHTRHRMRLWISRDIWL